MTEFFAGLATGIWLIGGLWLCNAVKKGLPILNNRGALCFFILCGPLAWVQFVLSNVDWEGLGTRIIGFFVDLEAEKVANDILGKKKV